MKKFTLLISVIILTAACLQDPTLAGSGFEPVVGGMINDTVNSSMSKEQIDAISNTISKAADVYYSTKSSAVETQRLLSGTTTQKTQQTQRTQETQETRKTQETAKRSRVLDILKKIETPFLDAALNSNNHQ